MKAYSREKRGRLAGIFKKGDLLVVAVLLIALIPLLYFALKPSAGFVEIYVDGERVYNLPLDEDRTVELLDGAMVVCVGGGKAWVECSDCAEQLCVKSSAISKEGGAIVCLPNRVVVKITSEEVDAIT